MHGYIWASAAVLLLVVTATVIVIVNQNRKLNQLHDDLRTINDSQNNPPNKPWPALDPVTFKPNLHERPTWKPAWPPIR
jgi:hypothetical protein